MSSQIVWVVDNGSIVNYVVEYNGAAGIGESIAALHREIMFILGKRALDVSLGSGNAMGTRLATDRQKLDDKTVMDVCAELMHNKADDGSEDYAMTTAMIFDWVYMKAVSQNAGGEIDLSDFAAFTDVRARLGKHCSAARAIAEYKVLQDAEQLSELLDNFELFSYWCADHVMGTMELPACDADFRILREDPEHISIVSRLSKNLLSVVADELQAKLWEHNGEYIIYAGIFNEEWLHDFTISA